VGVTQANGIYQLGSFDLPTTQFYAAEILSALEHVHAKKVIHRYVVHSRTMNYSKSSFHVY
jgi:serine/threonine protein kinase